MAAFSWWHQNPVTLRIFPKLLRYMKGMHTISHQGTSLMRALDGVMTWHHPTMGINFKMKKLVFFGTFSLSTVIKVYVNGSVKCSGGGVILPRISQMLTHAYKALWQFFLLLASSVCHVVKHVKKAWVSSLLMELWRTGLQPQTVLSIWKRLFSWTILNIERTLSSKEIVASFCVISRILLGKNHGSWHMMRIGQWWIRSSYSGGHNLVIV